MTVSAECACGATLQIEDASELTTMEVLGQWYEAHRQHRVTAEEYRIRMQSIHGRLAE